MNERIIQFLKDMAMVKQGGEMTVTFKVSSGEIMEVTDGAQQVLDEAEKERMKAKW